MADGKGILEGAHVAAAAYQLATGAAVGVTITSAIMVGVALAAIPDSDYNPDAAYAEAMLREGAATGTNICLPDQTIRGDPTSDAGGQAQQATADPSGDPIPADGGQAQQATADPNDPSSAAACSDNSTAATTDNSSDMSQTDQAAALSQ